MSRTYNFFNLNEMDSNSQILHLPSTDQSPSDEEKSTRNMTELRTEKSLMDENSSPLWKLYETIRTYVGNDGIRMSEYFSGVPPLEDELTDETENCLSMFLIRKRLVNGFYDYVSEIAEDFNNLWEDTKKLSDPSSKLYKCAVELQKVMQNKVKELIGFQYKDFESEDDSDDEPSQCLKTSDSLKGRLQSLCQCLLDYTTEDGNQPIFQFMEKPSEEIYPDYYERIQDPIDMSTIEENVRTDEYSSERELLEDLKLMFRNYREYYGEESSSYKYTITLEKVLIDHARSLGVVIEDVPAISNTTKVETPDTFIDISSRNTPTSTTACEIDFSIRRRRRGGVDGRRFKAINGYILYSSVSRRNVKANNPDKELSFGDISRIVGSEWKKLPISERYLWEKRADRLNKKNQANVDPLCSTVDRKSGDARMHIPQVRSDNHLWECRWNNCDRVFENLLDCLEHSISYDKGHVASSFDYRCYGKYQCLWNNCLRIEKGSPPFPSLHRLVRHVKEVHIVKGQCADPLSDCGSSNPSNPPKSDPLLFFLQHPETSDPLKRRLYSWCRLLLDIRTKAGRQPMLPFIGKPSANSYEQTQEPTNMSKLLHNISVNKYSSELELLKDFKLMFRNYRERNPNHLPNWKDAEILERILTDRAQMLGLPLGETPSTQNLVKIETCSEFREDLNIRTSNDNANAVLKVDPSPRVSVASNTDGDFLKVERTDSFEGRYSQMSNVRPLDTFNDDIGNVITEKDPPYLPLVSNPARVDCKNLIKVEVPDTTDVSSNTVSSDIKVLKTSNDDIANVIMDSSYPSPNCNTQSVGVENFTDLETPSCLLANLLAYNGKNFAEFEKIDPLQEDSNMRPSNLGTQKTSHNAPTNAILKPQKSGPEQLNRKPFNGYILYSRETRRIVSNDNPRMSFGEISRLIGAKWKGLSAAEKKMWGDEAVRVSQECVDQRERVRSAEAKQPAKQEEQKTPGRVYWECRWSNCAFIFENQRECLDHAVAERTGHVSSWFTATNVNGYRRDKIFQCLWNNCPRIERGAPPFPSLHRLLRHVKQVHILRNPGRNFVFSNQLNDENSGNFVPDSLRIHNALGGESNDHPMKEYSGQEEEEVFILD